MILSRVEESWHKNITFLCNSSHNWIASIIYVICLQPIPKFVTVFLVWDSRISQFEKSSDKLRSCHYVWFFSIGCSGKWYEQIFVKIAYTRYFSQLLRKRRVKKTVEFISLDMRGMRLKRVWFGDASWDSPRLSQWLRKRLRLGLRHGCWIETEMRCKISLRLLFVNSTSMATVF